MTGVMYGVFCLTEGGTPIRYGLHLSQWGKPGCLPSESLPLFPSDTCIVWERSSIPCCNTRDTLVGTETPVCPGKSICIAHTPSELEGEMFRLAWLGMSTCIACTFPRLWVACPGRSACAAYTPSLGGLTLPVWE